MSEKSAHSNTGAAEKATVNRRSYLRMLSAGAGAAAGVGAGGAGFTTLGTEGAQAGSTIIDDFEDSDLSEYSFDRGSSGASVVSTPTYNGSNALAISGTVTEMISTSGLNYYPSSGDTFRYWIRESGGADDINLSYGVQDHDNRYFVRVDFANGNLKLYRYENASATLLAEQTSGDTLAADTWYEVEVNWESDGSQTVTLLDSSGTQLYQVTTTDTTWSSGGVGYDAYLGSSQTLYIDYVIKGVSSGETTPNGPDIPGGGLVVDNFEDQNISEYQSTFNSSDISFSQDSYFGSYSLQLGPTGKSVNEILSYDGLPSYPSAGDEFSFWIKHPDVSYFMFKYGIKKNESREWGLFMGKNKIDLRYTEDNTTYTLDEDNSSTFSVDTWYKIHIDWGRDGSHSATVSDSSGNTIFSVNGSIDQWSGISSNSRSGGIGFYLEDTDTPAHIDSFVVENQDDSGAGVVVEDFEYSDLSQYSFDRGESGASVVSSPTLDGSQALEISGTNTEMIKTTGLPNEPEAGDTFSYWVQATGGADLTNFRYGVQDHTNGYFVRVDFGGDNLKLYKYENGSATLLDKKTSGFTLDKNRWYEIKIDWRSNGRHIIRLHSGEEFITVEDTDKTWIRGGIGFDAYLSSGESVYFDTVQKNKYYVTDDGLVVDNFDDSNIDEYTIIEGSPTTTSSPTYFGSNALEISDTDTELVSTSGLSRYPSQGDRFRARVQSTGGADVTKLFYGVQETNRNERYVVVINFLYDSVKLFYTNGTSRTKIGEDTTNCILTENEWFQVEIDWRSDGTHTVMLMNSSGDQLVQFSGTNSLLDTGGIGFAASLSSSGGTVYWDHALVDGMNQKLEQLANNHGGIDRVEFENKTDINGDSRIVKRYYCGDDTTHDVIYRQVSSNKLKMTGLSTTAWKHICERGLNRTKNRRQEAAMKVNGGVF